ncbi:MAG: ATP-binding protein, partial [candidate division NC10 bacterium]|nr:ATP-binding protein [candidate division NC10 bacterium]
RTYVPAARASSTAARSSSTLYWVEHLKSGLVREARIIQGALTPILAGGAAPRRVQELADQSAAKVRARVTVIAAGGAVLGDSERSLEGAEAMENQAGRPEVRAALAGEIGSHIRRSRTLDVEMLYVAIPVPDGGSVQGVLRLALPVTEVPQAVAAVRWTVTVGGVLALALALAVGFFLSRRVTRPVGEMRATALRMAEGDFDRQAPVGGTGEIAELGAALNRMASRFKEKIQDLDGERGKLAAVLDGMAEGVIAVDPRGRILLLNPAARTMFNLQGETAEGRPFLEAIRQKALLDLLETCRAYAPGETCRREVELGPPIGRILEAHVAPVRFGAEGRGSLLVLHDITALRHLEQVRKEFVANVSHELRTPLTSIRGYLETLLDGGLEDPAHARRFLEVAHTHTERLSRLVDDLLQLSDIETGKLILKPAPVGLHEVAAHVLAIFDSPAGQKRLVLENHVPSDLSVQADRDRLAQILVNLVDNAVKYTPEGGRIAVGATQSPGGFVEVRVADTGMGIPSTDLPRLTERFYRVDKARSRELGGTGLGLAIVKHLVQAHGGELEIDSELNRGTTVRITLPAESALRAASHERPLPA